MKCFPLQNQISARKSKKGRRQQIGEVITENSKILSNDWKITFPLITGVAEQNDLLCDSVAM